MGISMERYNEQLCKERGRKTSQTIILTKAVIEVSPSILPSGMEKGRSKHYLGRKFVSSLRDN